MAEVSRRTQLSESNLSDTANMVVLHRDGN